MGSGGRERPAVCLAVAVFLMCYLVQLTDCLGLRKTQIRVVKREADFTLAAGVQEGKIVFGKVFEFPDGNKKQSSNASVDDGSDYQADFTGWSRHTDVDEASKEKWNNLETSLHCFGDHMKFRSLGPGASQLAVVQANDPPMPLSMVPPRCGYRMHGNLMAFVMIAPYEGCNMIQQGGNYMLPLLWQGHPLSLLCPATQAPQQAPQQAPHQAFFDFYSLLQAAAEPVKPVHFPSYPFPYPHPTAPPSTPVSKDPYPYIPYPHPTAPPSTPVSRDPYPYIPYPHPTAPPSTPVSKDPYPYIPYPHPTAPPSTPVSRTLIPIFLTHIQRLLLPLQCQRTLIPIFLTHIQRLLLPLQCQRTLIPIFLTHIQRLLFPLQCQWTLIPRFLLTHVSLGYTGVRFQNFLSFFLIPQNIQCLDQRHQRPTVQLLRLLLVHLHSGILWTTCLFFQRDNFHTFILNKAKSEQLK
ncbi:uncharacterized protein LOC124870172 isoform X2 [Girardinichthys multiradiatus]|uniref:uncharacterized protein LOC124870172 isoform X2 n=1 Tax=Girardinichthys multiradiatus TaxID=208333 RepID=UPI001FAB7FE6|nr:uncharacterized protein LOC124870172 isoform X2 [Girardinichthys multiradiatus]